MINKIIEWIKRKCPSKLIQLDGLDYLERYTIVWTPFFKVYMHNILRSDLDRNLHNHPWHFLTILLKGSYKETLKIIKNQTSFKEKVQVYGPGSTLFRPAHHYHRIELGEETVTSIVIAGPKFQDWGFLVDNKLIPHKEYEKMGKHIQKEGNI